MGFDAGSFHCRNWLAAGPAATPVMSVFHLPVVNRLAAKIFSRRINACCERNSTASRSMLRTASAFPRNWSGMGLASPHTSAK